MMKRVIKCEKKLSMSRSDKATYHCFLECGCVGRKPCRWNRIAWVPKPPSRMKCHACGAAAEDAKP
jgi:hypothetical protein